MSEATIVEEPVVPSAEAVKGDLTRGPILRTLILFSIPTLISNVLQTFGQTISAIWVGRLIGESALAATVNANMVLFLAFATVFGFSMATTVKVGQYFGARTLDPARRVFGTGTGFCTALSLVGSVLGLFFAEPLLRLLATPQAILDMALSYLLVALVSIPLATMTMMISMSMRGAGDARTPLYGVIVTAAVVIVLNPLLVLGLGPLPQLGIAGAAWAQVFANIAGLLVLIAILYARDLPLRLRGRELAYLAPWGDDLAYVVGKGMPMGAQMLITSSSALIMIGLVNREGMLTTAAYGALMQIWNYIQMPSFAISTAVSAMVAQNVGADQHTRVSKITKAGLATNVATTLTLSLLLLAFDRVLISLFVGTDSGAIPIAERIQLIATWSWVLVGAMMIYSGTMRSYGVVIAPLIIMGIALYPARLGFYFLFVDLLGADALWWAYPFSSAIALALMWLTYARGRWRDKLGVNAAIAEGR